jgi:AbrB family looped-hinge helix DNA binding protein
MLLPIEYRNKKGSSVAATATLSSRFRISIPKALREEQNWEAGQEFMFIPRGKGVLLMPVTELEQLVGLAKGAKSGDYRDRKDRF